MNFVRRMAAFWLVFILSLGPTAVGYADHADCLVDHQFVGAGKWWSLFSPQGAGARILVLNRNLVCTGAGAPLTFTNSWVMVNAGPFGCHCWIQAGAERNNKTLLAEPIAFSQWKAKDGTLRTRTANYVGGYWTFTVEKAGSTWYMKYGDNIIDQVADSTLAWTPKEVGYRSEIQRPSEHFMGSSGTPVEWRLMRYKEGDGSWTYPGNSALGFSTSISHGKYQTTTDPPNGFNSWDDRN